MESARWMSHFISLCQSTRMQNVCAGLTCCRQPNPEPRRDSVWTGGLGTPFPLSAQNPGIQTIIPRPFPSKDPSPIGLPLTLAPPSNATHQGNTPVPKKR